MANFNNLNVIPDRGLKTDQSPRVLMAKYGDGYEQRVAAGINNLPESWDLTWNNRSNADANKVIKFLEDEAGVTTFDWYPPDTEISSTVTDTDTNKLIDSAQIFTNRYLNSTVTDSGGTGAAATAVVSEAGAVESISVTANGTHYKSISLPLITFTGGGNGAGAAATPVVSAAGAVTSISVTAGGSNYTSVPTVVITPVPKTTTVTAIDSATQISLAANIMLYSGEAYAINPYKKYKCSKWGVTTPELGYKNISATFIRVFEP